MDIVKHLSAGLKELDAERPEWDESKLHVSDLGVYSGLKPKDRKCPRQLWYRLNGYEKEPITDGKRLMFAQGNHLEEIIIDALKTQGVVEAAKISAGSEEIKGGIDVLLKNPDKRELVIVDVKTRRGNAFRYNSEIKPAEKMQVIGYAMNLHLQGYEVHKGAILEVDREGQNFARVFEFEIGQAEREACISANREIMKIYDMKKPPDGMNATLKRKANKGKDALKLNIPWQCRYCGYADTVCDWVPCKETRDKHVKVVGHIGDNIDIDEDCKGFEIEGEEQ